MQNNDGNKRAGLGAFILTAALLAAPITGCHSRLKDMDLSDPAITARVKAALKLNEDLDIRYMEVNTHMRSVTLSGLVESFEDRHRIKRIVRRVPGVRNVMINLVVQE